jgi:hypothetical protein
MEAGDDLAARNRPIYEVKRPKILVFETEPSRPHDERTGSSLINRLPIFQVLVSHIHHANENSGCPVKLVVVSPAQSSLACLLEINDQDLKILESESELLYGP